MSKLFIENAGWLPTEASTNRPMRRQRAHTLRSHLRLRLIALISSVCVAHAASRDVNVSYRSITAVSPVYTYIDASEFAKYNLVRTRCIANNTLHCPIVPAFLRDAVGDCLLAIFCFAAVPVSGQLIANGPVHANGLRDSGGQPRIG